MPPTLPSPNDLPEDAAEDEVTSAIDSHPVTVGNDSDSGSYSDEENPSHSGYELLSQDPDICLSCPENVDFDEVSDFSNLSIYEANSDQNPVVNSYFSQAINIPLPQEELLSEISGDTSTDNHLMDDEHIEKIKAAMKNFTLPSCNVPSWASVVPDEVWKAQLFSRLQNKNSKGSSLPCKSKSNSTSQSSTKESEDS